MAATSCSNCCQDRVESPFDWDLVCVSKFLPRRRCMKPARAPNSSAAGTRYWPTNPINLPTCINTTLDRSCGPVTIGGSMRESWCKPIAEPMARTRLSFQGSFAPSVKRSSIIVDLAIACSLAASLVDVVCVMFQAPASRN